MSFQYDAKTGGFVNLPEDPVQRRMALAQMLSGRQQNRAPSQSWGEGLANMASDLVQAHTMASLLRQGEQRTEDKDNIISGAVQAGMAKPAETSTYGDGTTIKWDAREARPDMTANMLMANELTKREGAQMAQHQQASQAAAAAERAKLDYQAKLERENEGYKPIKDENGSIVIPALTPGYPGSGQSAQHPAAPSVSAAKPAAPTTSQTPTTTQPPAAPGVDQRTSPTARTTPVQREVPEVFRDTIAAHADRTGLPADLLGQVFMTESGGRPDVVSGQTVSLAGAQGPMQVMPGTQRNPGFGVTPAKDSSPEENFRVGADYLAAMVKRYGDTKLALMAYNWGPGNVDAWIKDGSDPSKVPAETRGYVTRIAGDQPPAAPKGVQVATASDGSVRSDVTAAYDSAVPPGSTATPQPPAAPGSVRADLEQNTPHFENGRLVGVQSAPKTRPATPEERKAYNIPDGIGAQVDVRTGKLDLINPKTGVQETEYDKSMGKQKGDVVAGWRTQAETARSQIQTMDQLVKTLDNGLDTGSVKQATATWLQGIGIPQGLTDSFFSATDQKAFEAASNQLVLGLVKGLGANPSDADRAFIERTVPTLRNTPEAIRDLVGLVKRRAQDSISKSEAGYAYAKSGGDPLEFDRHWGGALTKETDRSTLKKGKIYDVNGTYFRFDGTNFQPLEG